MKILVFGYYHKENLGDDLFCEAFNELFPQLSFSFVNSLRIEDIKKASAIFIGGGSFLEGDPSIETDECLTLMMTKKIFFLGIGAETNIHNRYQELLKSAKLIALRSNINIEKIRQLNSNVMVIPDLVYAIKPFINQPKTKRSKSVLILPNISTIPQNGDPHWKYDSWNHFKFEFSQFLDYLIENGFQVNFFPMCLNKRQNDNWAAYEIINAMKRRNGDNLLANKTMQSFNEYELIITQRYHGIILAEIAQIPYISIFHHDKLKQSYFNNGIFMSYFSSSKQDFIDQFNLARKSTNRQQVIIRDNLFNDLVTRVNLLLSNEA